MSEREANWWRFCAPYGVWWCKDGRIALFNRAYEPLLVYSKKDGLRDLRRNYENSEWDTPRRKAELFPWKRQAWFYTDGNAPASNAETRERITGVVADFLEGKMPRYNSDAFKFGAK